MRTSRMLRSLATKCQTSDRKVGLSTPLDWHSTECLFACTEGHSWPALKRSNRPAWLSSPCTERCLHFSCLCGVSAARGAIRVRAPPGSLSSKCASPSVFAAWTCFHRCAETHLRRLRTPSRCCGQNREKKSNGINHQHCVNVNKYLPKRARLWVEKCLLVGCYKVILDRGQYSNLVKCILFLAIG